ncbi:MAG TPA: hypothetical protein VEQ65_02210, partial [Opitutus sp.]|nr:hypothetical protein [Opitutus sp.]
ANGEIHVVYTGASGPVMPHAVRTLLEGFRRFRDSEPATARRFRFHFLGTSYAAPGEARCSVLPLAEALGVVDQVSEQPHRLGHLECLRLQSEADILFLGGSSDPAYSPSKLYPYFAAGRPILAVVFPQSVLEAALAEFSGAFLVHMGPSSAEEASARLERFFRSAVAGFPAGSLPVRDEQLFAARYHAESTTRRQCELFDAAHAFAAGATQPALSIP